MALYYNGDLDKDLQNLAELPYVPTIKGFLVGIAYGRLQQLAKERDTWGHGDNGPEGQLLQDILRLVDQIGLSEFCRVTQTLWAEFLRKNYPDLPLSGAIDFSDPASLS